MWWEIVDKFVEAHEKLLIVAVLVVAGWFAYGKYLNYSDKHATAAEQQALVAAQQQQLVVAQQTAQFHALEQRIDAQNATIHELIAARNVAEKKQQAADATAPLPDVVRRIADLSGTDIAQFSVAPTGVTVSEPATRKIAETLEEVPVLQQNFADEQKIVTGQAQEIVSCKTLVVSQATEIKKNDALCQAEITKVKADASKAKRKWFVVGAVAAIVIKGAVSIFAGI